MLLIHNRELSPTWSTDGIAPDWEFGGLGFLHDTYHSATHDIPNFDRGNVRSGICEDTITYQRLQVAKTLAWVFSSISALRIRKPARTV